MKSAFQIKLQGFPPANRGAKVELRNVLTGVTVKRDVFLDGSVTVRDLDPGEWEVEVSHRNLLDPLFRKRVHLLPTRRPTYIPVPVKPAQFQDHPIRDVPDADLGPVQDRIAAVKANVGAVGTRSPGELIRAEDWTTLAGAVADLADTVMELTHLVAPLGHNHPPLEEKIAEMRGNLLRFASSFGRSILEVRREQETKSLEEQVRDILGDEGTMIVKDLRDLQGDRQADTWRFTGKMASTGDKILRAIATKQGGADGAAFAVRADVEALGRIARQFAEAGPQSDAAAELGLHAGASAVRAGLSRTR